MAWWWLAWASTLRATRTRGEKLGWPADGVAGGAPSRPGLWAGPGRSGPPRHAGSAAPAGPLARPEGRCAPPRGAARARPAATRRPLERPPHGEPVQPGPAGPVA